MKGLRKKLTIVAKSQVLEGLKCTPIPKVIPTCNPCITRSYDAMGPCLAIHIIHEAPHVYLQPLNACKGIFVCGLNLHPMALWNIRYFSKHFSNVRNIANEIGKYLQNFNHEIECMVILFISSSSPTQNTF